MLCFVLFHQHRKGISRFFILLLFRIFYFMNLINLMSYSPAFSIICFLFPVLMKDRCKLFCRVAGTTAYYQLKDRVIDGTPCGTDTFDICVQGLCRVYLSVSSFTMNVHTLQHQRPLSLNLFSCYHDMQGHIYLSVSKLHFGCRRKTNLTLSACSYFYMMHGL